MTTDVLPVVGAASAYRPPHMGTWTVADYEQLPDDGPRYEIVQGDLRMAPAPLVGHQDVSIRLAFLLFDRITNRGLGRVLAAPTDVELAFDTILQPDLLVVLPENRAQITSHRVIGPPDLIIEITSPSTASYDRREKRDAYARAGVREYWIADPATQTVELLVLAGNQFEPIAIYTGAAIIPSRVLAVWGVPTRQLFGG